jgi:hypothetical protein
LTAALRKVEQALPRQPELDALMREHRPDVVLLTPLLRLGSSQIEVLRSARANGARTGLCVASWDHLSSKARIAELPDRVSCGTRRRSRRRWNCTAFPRSVVVTGAQCYDEWYERRAVRTREAFCATLGLPADRPLILYACSAFSPPRPSRPAFVRRWIEGIRACDDPVLRSAAILVRPHPQRHDEWNEVQLSDLPDVTLYGSHPLDEQSKNDYFESLTYLQRGRRAADECLPRGLRGGPARARVRAARVQGAPGGPDSLPLPADRGGGLFKATESFDTHLRELAASSACGAAPGSQRRVRARLHPPRGLDGRPRPSSSTRWRPSPRRPRRRRRVSPCGRRPCGGACGPSARAVHRAVGEAANPTDRTVIELQQARRRDQHRRDTEADTERRQQERDSAREDKQARAAAVRQAELRVREEKLARRPPAEGRAARRAGARSGQAGSAESGGPRWSSA